MTRDDIIKLAREAGFVEYELDDGTTDAFDVRYERFANLVAAAEREACAALAEKTICDKHIPTGVSIYGTRAAKAIRARKTP